MTHGSRLPARNTRLLIYASLLLATFALTSCPAYAATSAPQVAWDKNDNVGWQGPGYYVYDIAHESYDLYYGYQVRVTFKTAGVFATKSDCAAAITGNAVPQERDSYKCIYFGTKAEFDRLQ